MGGFFGAASHRDVVMDVFFGVDYHSHLGTRRAGMIFHDSEDQGFQREIHSIENTPFRTRFEDDLPGKAASAASATPTRSRFWYAPIWARSPSPRSAPSTTPRRW